MIRKSLRAYTAWTKMKSRCDNPAYIRSKHYSGRGITYDPKWADFLSFYNDMGDCPEGLQLDRTNNNGNYCKENCKWVSPRDNVRNRSIIKLDVRKVKLIKALLRAKKPGVSKSALAEVIAPLFNVKSNTIRKVFAGCFGSWREAE